MLLMKVVIAPWFFFGRLESAVEGGQKLKTLGAQRGQIVVDRARSRADGKQCWIRAQAFERLPDSLRWRRSGHHIV